MQAHVPSRPSATPWVAIFVSLLFIMLLEPMLHADAISYNGWRVLRVVPTNADQLELLEVQVQALGPNAAQLWRRHPAADVLVHPDAADALENFLRAHDIPMRVHLFDVGEEIRSERSHQVSRRNSRTPDILHSYLSHTQINRYLNRLAARYPDTVKVVTIGESYEARRIKAIQISTGGNGHRPVILVDAGIHAREWIAPSMALYLINQLVENPLNADLLQRVDWHIIPLLNPDGYEYSHTTDRMWRKTRSRTGSRLCYGADPNRNFDYFWGVVGVSWDPCKETYPGSMPFSELETQALANYGMGLRGHLRLYVSVHSYGGLFIHPWGYSYYKPTDSLEMVEMAKAVAGAIKAAGIRKFDIGNCFETLGELAAGGSDDWMKAVAGANYSFTLEMPVSSFTTPAAEIGRYVVPTFEGFRAMGRIIDDQFG